MHFKHLLKGLTIGTPILAAAVLTACHSESDIVGKYVNPNNPKQTLTISPMKSYVGENDGKPYYELHESKPCGYRYNRDSVNFKNGKLTNINTGEKVASVDGDQITIDLDGCSITYKKVDD